MMVCDVAIGHVRRGMRAAFGDKVVYTTVEGQGTLVEAEGDVEAQRFTQLAQAAIARAQAAQGDERA